MSQYKDGTASVNNNSNIVTGSGTLWLANISAGDLFTKAGDDVAYTVAGVTNNTILTLTAPYSGSSSSGSNYGITIGFTAGGLPLLSAGDLNTAAIYNEAMKNIDNQNQSLGTAAYADLTTSTTDTTVGRVLRVQDFGLGGTMTRMFAVDPNTLSTGFYTYRRQSDGDTPPAFVASNLYSTVIPFKNELSSLSQSLVITNDQQIYLTSGNPDKFANQVKMWHTGNTIVDVNDFIKEL